MQSPVTIAGTIVDPLNGLIEPGVVEIAGGRIAARRRTESPRGPGYIMPGFIDAHVHVESSMLIPSEFARLAAARGTVAAVSDPHEIANVLGVPGVRYMIENGRSVPFKFFFGAPSCVPATAMETSGARLGPAEIDALLDDPEIRYLSEMMNYPGVLSGDPEVMAKIRSAVRRGKVVDGHAPGLKGEELRRYAAAGISTDHECRDREEALAKLALGMKILIREGSAAGDLDALGDLMATHTEQCMLCSDDKHPNDLLRGHLDAMAGRAIAAGIDPLKVLRCACVNPVLHYGLDVGLLREGDPADLIVVGDLRAMNVLRTYIGGVLAADGGQPAIGRVAAGTPNSFAAAPKTVEEFRVEAAGGMMNVIVALDRQIVTDRLTAAPTVAGGLAVADPGRDLLKIAVVNRYRDARPAVGFVTGFGLRTGAIASSVAHDSHNIVAVGAADEDLCAAVNLVIAARGGLAAVAGNRRELLPLPVAGLMSAEDGFTVAGSYTRLDAAAKELGSRLTAPFMTLSFMALPVVPMLKMSDRGLFDGERFELIGLFV